MLDPAWVTSHALDALVPAADPARRRTYSPDVINLRVVNAAQVESMLFGADGAADRLRPGAVFVMCSTVDPGWSAELEGRLAGRGVLYLDAPLSGGAARAETGELTMMTSGSAAYAVADPVLEATSGTVYRLGERARRVPAARGGRRILDRDRQPRSGSRRRPVINPGSGRTGCGTGRGERRSRRSPRPRW
nr:NAD(P)-binding domain-containing protein [Streptomyces sp. NBRC 110028]